MRIFAVPERLQSGHRGCGSGWGGGGRLLAVGNAGLVLGSGNVFGGESGQWGGVRGVPPPPSSDSLVKTEYRNSSPWGEAFSLVESGEIVPLYSQVLHLPRGCGCQAAAGFSFCLSRRASNASHTHTRSTRQTGHWSRRPGCTASCQVQCQNKSMFRHGTPRGVPPMPAPATLHTNAFQSSEGAPYPVKNGCFTKTGGEYMLDVNKGAWVVAPQNPGQ